MKSKCSEQIQLNHNFLNLQENLEINFIQKEGQLLKITFFQFN